MYLTVCPLRGPGHNSSAGNECISLPALSVARVMIAQWDDECILLSVLSVVRVLFAAVVGCFKELTLAEHMCCLVHISGGTNG